MVPRTQQHEPEKGRFLPPLLLTHRRRSLGMCKSTGRPSPTLGHACPSPLPLPPPVQPKVHMGWSPASLKHPGMWLQSKKREGWDRQGSKRSLVARAVLGSSPHLAPSNCLEGLRHQCWFPGCSPPPLEYPASSGNLKNSKRHCWVVEVLPLPRLQCFYLV